MPLTVDEYVQHTKTLIAHGDWNSTIEPASAILQYAALSSMTGGGFAFVADFGVLVCWCRYSLLVLDFAPDNAPLWKYTQEQLDHRRADAEKRLDALLGRFVREGYVPEMGQELLRIGSDDIHGYALDAIYVLPGDLEQVLEQVGNLLVDEDLEDDDEAVANMAQFDLNNAEHRSLLADRLNDAGA